MAEAFNAKGWLGRPDSLDFEAVDAGRGILRHSTTGYLFQQSREGYPGDTIEYFSISIPGGWRSKLKSSVHFVDIKKARSEGYKGPQESEAYRHKHGYHNYFSWPSMDEGPVPTPWTPEMVELFLRAYLIRMDIEGFYFGKRPFPDRVDFAPPNLSESLHRSLKNIVPPEVKP